MSVNPENIRIIDFNYLLPDEKIAQYPLTERDGSKLLICDKGTITSDIFRNIPAYIPAGSLLIFNDTKVVNARLIFKTSGGKPVEIFCLEPANPEITYSAATPVKWSCMVGNLKAWKWKDEVLRSGFTVAGTDYTLNAELTVQNPDANIINFFWDPPGITFAEVLASGGFIPLPPYVKRKPVEKDKETYQTIYAVHEGSVAAPTAGLHFTDAVITSLRQKKINIQNVTLHVGAGTFKPVKSEKIIEHEMHSESFFINKEAIESIISKRHEKIISAGTTTIRTIESVYWFGVQLLQGRAASGEVAYISQWEPYEYNTNITMPDSLSAVLDHLNKTGQDKLSGRTCIIIVPGYEFRIFNGLITNFHQPGSTLLLLIAAFIGGDWKKVYDYALNNDFRFLSYGDSSILFK